MSNGFKKFNYNFEFENMERANALYKLAQLFRIPEDYEDLQKPLRKMHTPARVDWEAAISDLASASKRPLKCNAQHWTIHEGNLCLSLKELLRREKPDYKTARTQLFFWCSNTREVWEARQTRAKAELEKWQAPTNTARKENKFKGVISGL